MTESVRSNCRLALEETNQGGVSGGNKDSITNRQEAATCVIKILVSLLTTVWAPCFFLAFFITPGGFAPISNNFQSHWKWNA